MEQVLRLEAKPLRYYSVYLRDGNQIRVRANSYCATDYGTYAFYLEEGGAVYKGTVKGNPPTPVYETPRRDVHSVAEEGHTELMIRPRKTRQAKKKVPEKKTSSSVAKKAKA